MQTIKNLFQYGWDLLTQLKIVDYIDMVIVAYLIYQLLKMTRETRANQVLKGMGFVLIALQLSRWLQLTAINWILEYILTNIAVVTVVLFQPELRKAFEKLGRGGNKILGKAFHARTVTASYDEVIEEIVRATLDLARTKTGALIIMQRSPLKEILDTGTYLYARVSRALLGNIFVPNTPLHDGATVIAGDQILASGCFLPLTSSDEVPKELGTRHRAAIGMSENSDAMIIVVSEETGVISIAEKGNLERYIDVVSLKRHLQEYYLSAGSQESAGSWTKRILGSKNNG